MSRSKEKPKFEDAMQRLEELVGVLENGDGSLDDALSAFEEGIGLLKYCNDLLNEAEQKVEILIRDESGNISGKEIFPTETTDEKA